MLRRSFLSSVVWADERPQVVVVISANAEWAPARRILGAAAEGRTPYGEFFTQRGTVFLHGGWGKVDAAASAQYAIGRWNPKVLINLGTCGGMEGAARRDEVILAERTVIYDIVERMGDSEKAVRDYVTQIDLGWLTGRLPAGVRKATLVSADADLNPADIPGLRKKYDAVAADWESGAIARVAARNGKRTLILRGVTDLVGLETGEAYGNLALFQRRSEEVMAQLLKSLPWWVERSLA